LVCDGYCIFDFFSQSQCNTHHAQKNALQTLIGAIPITNPKKLELYHYLVGDGYCIFDIYSQNQCNTHHAPKNASQSFFLMQYLSQIPKNGIVSLFGWSWVLHI